jgi:ATP-dependent Lon protease
MEGTFTQNLMRFAHQHPNLFIFFLFVVAAAVVIRIIKTVKTKRRLQIIKQARATLYEIDMPTQLREDFIRISHLQTFIKFRVKEQIKNAVRDFYLENRSQLSQKQDEAMRLLCSHSRIHL